MTRIACAVVLVVLLVAAPAHAAKPTFSVKSPSAGDMSLAHVTFETKGGTGTPKLVLTNRSKLGSRLTVAGGVLKLKKNRYLVSAALLLQTGGGGGTAAFKIVPPKGMTFKRITGQLVGKNLLANTAAPKYCSAAPASFAYVAKKLLAGSFVPRFPSAQEYVIAGYRLNCPAGGYEDRANLAAALRGDPDPGASPGGSGGGSDDEGSGGEDGEDGEDEGVPTSSTLTGSGTVAAEGTNSYRYRMTFNEPIFGYTVEVGGTSIQCPSGYDPCSAHNSVSAGGVTLSCNGGTYTFEFECFSRADRSSGTRTPPTPVPANTEISGTFTIGAGSVTAGRVKVVAYGNQGKSRPITLSGP